MTIEERFLPLQSAYRHEKEIPDTVYMTQPMGGGEVRTYTWKQTLDEARKMAGYLKAQGYPPGSRIAILSKNCSEFIIAELAIWMAGHVTVALFPTLDDKTVKYILEHSEASMLFVGKLTRVRNNLFTYRSQGFVDKTLVFEGEVTGMVIG